MDLIQLILEGNKYDSVVKFLMDGGNPNQKDDDGTPALALAAVIGSNDVVATLLNAGAYVDEPDADGNTALHRAATVGNIACIQLLIEAGADTNAKDLDGKTPFFLAAAMGETSACRQLHAAGSNAMTLDSKGRSALHWAAMRTDEPELIQFLIDLGIDPKIVDSYGSTALRLAKLFSHTQAAQVLLRYDLT